MLSFAIQVIHMKIYWPLILESTIHLWEPHSFKIPMLLHIVWLHLCDSHLFGEADIPIYQSSILSTKELHTSCKQFCAHFKLVRVLWVIKCFSTICSNYQDDHPSIWSKQLIENSSNTSLAVFFSWNSDTAHSKIVKPLLVIKCLHYYMFIHAYKSSANSARK